MSAKDALDGEQFGFPSKLRNAAPSSVAGMGLTRSGASSGQSKRLAQSNPRRRRERWFMYRVASVASLVRLP